MKILYFTEVESVCVVQKRKKRTTKQTVAQNSMGKL